jgi:hypothetical protein
MRMPEPTGKVRADWRTFGWFVAIHILGFGFQRCQGFRRMFTEPRPSCVGYPAHAERADEPGEGDEHHGSGTTGLFPPRQDHVSTRFGGSRTTTARDRIPAIPYVQNAAPGSHCTELFRGPSPPVVPRLRRISALLVGASKCPERETC